MCVRASTVTWQCADNINFNITSLFYSTQVLSKSVFLWVLFILYQETSAEGWSKFSMMTTQWGYLCTVTTSLHLDKGHTCAVIMVRVPYKVPAALLWCISFIGGHFWTITRDWRKLHNKRDEMGRACGMYGRERKCIEGSDKETWQKESIWKT
jgi:hypothetical protein